VDYHRFSSGHYGVVGRAAHTFFFCVYDKAATGNSIYIKQLRMKFGF
jgi:hypothetical protein